MTASFSISLRVVLFFVPMVLLSVPSASAIRYDKGTYQRKVYESKARERLNSFTVQNFTVLHEVSLTREQVSALTKVIESAIATVRNDFQFQPTGTYEVMLFAGGTYEKVDSSNQVTAGFYQAKKIRVRFGDSAGPPGNLGYFRKVFTHELTHLAIRSLDGGKMTRWMGEGLAVYEEKGIRTRTPFIAKELYERRNPKYRKLTPEQFFDFAATVNSDGTYPPGFYENSYAVTKFIIDEYGFPKVRDLLKRMKSGASFSAAFKEVYGMTPSEMGTKAYGF